MGASRRKETAVLISTLVLLTAFLASTVARADTFSWEDDPNGPLSVGSTSVSNNDLFRTLGVQNSGAAHDIGILIPIFQVFGNNNTPALQWNQSLNGWAGSVNGNSLLVTVTSPAGSLSEGEVADLSGVNQETLTLFGQTTNPSDSYPFIDLGVVQPNQTVFTTFDFHFNWGGSGSGVPPDGSAGNCGSNSSCYNFVFESVTPTPEPSSLFLLGTGLMVLAFAFVRRKAVSY
jgi:hypothetical protein